MKRLFDRLGWGLAGALGVAVVALAGGIVSAGPLTPPGPPAATQETLIFQPASCADFPIQISSGGSYKLASDINMPAACAKAGIRIHSNPGATLDLNGFSLRGVVGSLDGIQIDIGSTTVKNGYIQSWGDAGIEGNVAAFTSTIDGVTASFNTGEGILLPRAAHVRACTANGNSTQGISVGGNSVVEDCIASNNGLEGIILGNFLSATQGGTLTNCVAFENGNSGIAVLVPGATVRSCTSTGNNGHNIFVGDGADVRDNTVVGDVSSIDGIHMAGNGNHVEGNDVRGHVGADIAYRIAPGRINNVVIHNVASGGVGAFSVVAGNFLGAVVPTEGAMNAAANSNANIATP